MIMTQRFQDNVAYRPGDITAQWSDPPLGLGRVRTFPPVRHSSPFHDAPFPSFLRTQESRRPRGDLRLG